jgi:hypothetical protein
MKYWAYINDEIKGPLEKEEIMKLEGFNASTLICPQSPLEEETKEWKEASSFPEFATAATPAHNIDETSKSEGDINSGKLNVSDKKEDIMIERFSMENIFTTPVDSNNINLDIPNTDPLTLSQIRNREEEASQDLSSEEEVKKRTSSDPMTLSQIKNRGESMIEKMESDNEKKNTVSQDSTSNESNDVEPKTDDDTNKNLEGIEDFDIPDTDSLISSDVSATTADEQPVEMPREEPEEFNVKPLEAKNITEEDLKISARESNQDNDVNMLPVDDLKSTDINENTMGSSSANINNNLSNISETDINKIKEEILSEVKILIDEINSETVKKEELENIKNEIDNKLSAISVPPQPQSDTNEVLNHLEIEVNDLAAKLDMIQKRLDESQKSSTTLKQEEEVIEQNLKPANIERLDKVDKKEATKTVVMPLDEKKENKKLSELPKKILKPLITIILIIVAAVGILFFLKSAGIFDITKLFSKKDSNIQIQTKPQVDKTDNSTNLLSPDISTMTSLSTTTETGNFNLMNSTPTQLPEMKPGEQMKPGQNNPLTSDNAILNEVKNYRMEINENLEQVIKKIVREKKANVNSINWGIIPDKDSTYLITATVKNKKNILFKFNYEPNTKILKPLNTLSINTINILMGKANPQRQNKKVQPKSTAKQKSNTHKTEQKPLQQPTKEAIQESTDEEPIDKQNTDATGGDETSEDEYLIIGE